MIRPLYAKSLDFPEASLDTLKSVLIKAGFEPYITSVGGSGLGILSPSVDEDLVPTFTPPETPSPDGSSDGLDDTIAEPLREAFESKTREDLVEWATNKGSWLYV